MEELKDLYIRNMDLCDQEPTKASTEVRNRLVESEEFSYLSTDKNPDMFGMVLFVLSEMDKVKQNIATYKSQITRKVNRLEREVANLKSKLK